jgi:hypothetical protein
MSRVATKLIEDAAITSDKIATSAVLGTKLDSTAKQVTLESQRFNLHNVVEDFTASSSTTDDFTAEALAVSLKKATGGSRSVEGLVTTAPYNKTTILDHASQAQLYDDNENAIYGRVTRSNTALTGTLGMTNGDDDVTGTDTLFQSELVVGDWIEKVGANRLYKVKTITSNVLLVLDEVYLGTTESISAQKGTLTLSYYSLVAGVETAYTMAAQHIDVFFPESYNLYTAPFNSLIQGVGLVEAQPADHNHDSMYFTETELTATTAPSGASHLGVDNTSIVGNGGATTVQTILQNIARVGRYEKKTIATQDTIPNLTYTPREVSAVVLIVGAVPQRYGADKDYTVSGKVVTWYQAQAGFHIEAGDEVWASYDSSD